MKIGLMGGSFDPVHAGHLSAARCAMTWLELDKVIFIPAGKSPAKHHTPTTPGHHRIGMLRAAVADESRFEVSEFEVAAGGSSYTVNTVREFRDRFPCDDLFWIMGSDKVPSLSQWRSIEDIAQMVEFVCLERPGHPLRTPATSPGFNLRRCPSDLVDASSTDLRNRLKSKQPVGDLLSHKTIVYILKNDLYA
ncbi:MAG: nicotinate-nucleotide adenylyltransferase [Synoicihabitans sp.]